MSGWNESPNRRAKRGPSCSVLRPFARLSDRLTQAGATAQSVLKALSFAMVGVVNFAVDFSVFLVRLLRAEVADDRCQLRVLGRSRSAAPTS